MNITEQQRGILFVLVGPGGAGKNALMRIVLGQMENLKQLATATTRPIRDGELNGREHLFVTHDEFQKMIDEGALLEWQEVTPERFYGIPKNSIDNRLQHGEDLIADIDIYGAQILRKTYPDQAILIFITVPGETETEQLIILRERMNGRSESAELIEERLERAREIELPFAKYCDHLIVNDEMSSASQRLGELIQRERQKRTHVTER